MLPTILLTLLVSVRLSALFVRTFPTTQQTAKSNALVEPIFLSSSNERQALSSLSLSLVPPWSSLVPPQNNDKDRKKKNINDVTSLFGGNDTNIGDTEYIDNEFEATNLARKYQVRAKLLSEALERTQRELEVSQRRTLLLQEAMKNSQIKNSINDEQRNRNGEMQKQEKEEKQAFLAERKKWQNQVHDLQQSLAKAQKRERKMEKDLDLLRTQYQKALEEFQEQEDYMDELEQQWEEEQEKRLVLEDGLRQLQEHLKIQQEAQLKNQEVLQEKIEKEDEKEKEGQTKESQVRTNKAAVQVQQQQEEQHKQLLLQAEQKCYDLQQQLEQQSTAHQQECLQMAEQHKSLLLQQRLSLEGRLRILQERLDDVLERSEEQVEKKKKGGRLAAAGRRIRRWLRVEFHQRLF